MTAPNQNNPIEESAENIWALIKKLCPEGVEYAPLWSVTIWDKKFNSVDRIKQPIVENYKYLLAKDLFDLETPEGNVFLLSTGEKTGWTTEELAGEYLKEGEVVTIPGGKSRAVVDCIKYYKGKFVTADNRIATSNDTSTLLNKYLYYWMMSQGEVIDAFYRGSGIKHPDMSKVLDLSIPIPPLPVQREIVRILDAFTELTAELTEKLSEELTARKKQYAFYRDKMLSFNEGKVEWVRLGDVCSISSGRNKDKLDQGYYPVYGSTGVIAYTNAYVYDKEQILVARVGANAGRVHLANGRYDVSDNTLMIDVTSEYSLKFLFYVLANMNLNQYAKGGGQPLITAGQLKELSIPVPPLEIQRRIAAILDRFDTLCNDLSAGLPAEIDARRKQYEYYRDLLLGFEATNPTP